MKTRAFRSQAVLALAVILCLSLPLAGCGKKAGVAADELPVAAAPQPLVFTLFAGMNVAGYDTELGQSMHPVRQSVREALAGADPALFEDFGGFMLSGTNASLLSMVVNDIDGPPDIGTGSTKGITPQAAVALREVWEAEVEPLWEEFSPEHDDYGVELAGPATEALRSVLVYFGLQESPVASVELIPNLLDSTGSTASCEDKEESIFYIMVGPGGLPPIGIVQEFTSFLVSEDMRQALMDGRLKRFEPVLERAKEHELIAQTYRSVQGFVQECIERALTVKLVTGDPGDPEATGALLHAEFEAGFLLTPAFYDALSGYEEAGKTFLEYLPELLEAIDIDAVLEVAGGSAG